MKTILVLLISIISSAASAQAEVITEKDLAISNGKGVVVVTILKNEQPVSVPYRVEVRANCKNDHVAALKAEDFGDVVKVCDVRLKSVKLSEDGKYVLVTVRDTDAEAYNKLSRSLDPLALSTLKPVCQKQSREHRFEIAKLCHQ